MKVVSLFSGAGGFDLGLIQAGHEVVWANDILEDACATYANNIGGHIHLGDITEIDFSSLSGADLVVGGFPCQGFSMANMERRRDDPRNLLYLEFLRAVSEVKPKYFIAENVRGILSLDQGKVFAKVMSDFQDSGYFTQHLLLNAADFGVPQNRYRVFILGVRRDLEIFPEFKLIKGFGKTGKPWRTIGEALKDIPDPEESHNLKNHVYSKFKFNDNGYMNHRRLDPNKPSPTITARGDLKGGAMVNLHPKNHRRLSVREMAIIQTFPMNFEFHGAMTSCYLQLGNAVPPLLAKQLGEFLSSLDQGDFTPRSQLNMPV
jgi:DNA (cytosine-5)-methyltransferase 1